MPRSSSSSSSSSSWKWQFRDEDVVSAADVLRSSCPPDDDIRKLRPFRATKNSDDADADAHDAHDGDDEGRRTSRMVYVYVPPRLCTAWLAPWSAADVDLDNDDPPPSPPPMLRTILALHGYGGRAPQEIKKWRAAASVLDAIVLAPQGTNTASSSKLGWNAVHCCGDPVLEGIDDVDFVANGAVGALSRSFSRSRSPVATRGGVGRNDYDYDYDRAPPPLPAIAVIATGFSNGGFLASELGLMPEGKRPPWLAGIVPTGGYQYDVGSYRRGDVRPLPMMSHHGGRDSIVRPEGCCAAASTTADGAGGATVSNCEFDIGIEREECTSVRSAFEMWSRINGCSSTAANEDVGDGERRLKKVDKDRGPMVTCRKGIGCVEPTEFCLWNNEGHAWGGQFPGADMTRTWMEGVFRHAEEEEARGIGTHGDLEEDATKTVAVDRGDDAIVDASHLSAISRDARSGKAALIFSVAVASLGVVLLLCAAICYARASNRFGGGKGAKRKTSGENFGLENDEDHMALENLVLRDAS